MTRVLFVGDAAHTGFGTVTWDLATRLLALGVDIRLISQNVTGEPIRAPLGERTWDARVIHPAVVIVNGFKDGWKPEACIFLGDFASVRATVLNPNPAIAQAFASIPTFHYCPIEGVDLPPRWAEVWSVVRPVAMSEFGATQIEGVTGYRPPVVYHGVDTETFYPVAANHPGHWNRKPVISKEAARQAVQFPADRIMVLRTDRHMPRKQQNRLIRLMSKYVFDADPRITLVLHCRQVDEAGDLKDAKSKLTPEHQERVILTGAHDSFTGLGRSELNVLYNAADIYATNSAEGFGLTPAEALAAGVPVVAMDYSTMPEVVGPAGVLVPVDHLVDNEYDHQWAAVDERAFADAILRLASKPQLRRELGRQGPKHIAETFQWDRAAAQFAELVARATLAEVAA
jgi:glycosyltransferase involved in cell wall biosynthesis